MQANKRCDTAPEVALRSALHARGLRFRKDFRLSDVASRPRPDIVFPRAKVAIFVDGCFWHCCPEHGRPPASNTDYWTPKLERNVERDRTNNAALRGAGWNVVRIWEHVPLDEAVAIALRALGSAYPRSVIETRVSAHPSV
jgi:DNA mismatch endonuclease, patch repair protein